MGYRRADFRPLADTKYGVGFHWTTWTAPKMGEMTPFEDAVNAFDVKRFVSQVVECGAGHVLFPLTHMLHYMPCPNPVLDGIFPGRTCERDLVMELADELGEHGIPLILYYNFCFHGDVEWKQATCPDKSDAIALKAHIENTLEMVRLLGGRYGKKVIAFWFDTGFQEFDGFPFAEMTAAAKTGNPGRLVTYNNSIEVYKAYTEYQDFWWGEGVRLNYVPRGGALTPESGLPWYNFVDWHPDYMLEQRCGEWGIQMHTRDLEWPAPCVHSVHDFLKRFTDLGGAVTFNLFIWRDGEIFAEDLKVMRELKKIVR